MYENIEVFIVITNIITIILVVFYSLCMRAITLRIEDMLLSWKELKNGEKTTCEYCGKVCNDDELYSGISWCYSCKECGEIQKHYFVE